MEILRKRSWVLLIGGAVGASVLSFAGGAWADDPNLPNTPSAPGGAPAERGMPTPDMPKATAPADTNKMAQPPADSSDTAKASRTTESSVTVTALDRAARRLTLKDPSGEKYVVTVPANIEAFDTVKVGDRIDIDYYQSLAVAILPPGTKPSMTETSAALPTGEGAGAFGKRLTISAKVVNVDADAHEVTFKGPHGDKQTVKVQDENLQKKLPDLKPGDAVQLTYTEATAAAIRPAAAAK